MPIDLVRRHKSLAVLLATIVLMELAHGIEIVTLLPLYLTEHFGKDEVFVGLVASTYLLVDTLLTRTPAGMLADRWGRKSILVAGIVLSALPLPLMSAAGDANAFIYLNIVNGLGAGMIWPSIYALVADSYGPENRGTVLGLINMVMLGGLAVGGPITGSVVLAALGYPNRESYPLGFAACTVFVLIALVLVVAFVRETGPRSSISSGDLASPASPRRDTKANSRTAFSLLLLIGLAITLALGLIVPILTIFGTRVLQVSLGVFALILIPPALTAAIGLIPAGRWADKKGRHAPMLLGLTLIAIPFWGSALSTNPVVVSAGGMVAASGYALLVPAWNALVMDWIPSARRGLFLGGVATVQGLGLAAGPVIGGALFQVNPYAPFWAAGAFLSLAVVFAAMLTQRREKAWTGLASIEGQ